MNGSGSNTVGVELEEGEFLRVATIAKNDFGLDLPASKSSLVYSRLSRRLRKLGLSSFGDYIDLVESAAGKTERRQMLSSLTTNVTKFFREAHHFQHFEESVLPDLLSRASMGARVRLWSAGCSSGPEPYSMAMSTRLVAGEAQKSDIKILASDVDPDILNRAAAGRFSEQEISTIPETYRQFVCKKTTGSNNADPGRQYEITPSIKEMISFRVMNLVRELPVTGPFDVIFCRNVAIYFDQDTQESVWNKFAGLLAPGGYLYIGHSERISGPALARLKSVGITTYQKSRV